MGLEQLREELRQKVEELEGLQQKAQGDEGLTEEEEKRFDSVLGETEELRNKIEQLEQRQQRMQNIQGYANSPQGDFDPRSANVPQNNQGNQPNQSGRYSPNAVPQGAQDPNEFRNLGEFLYCVRFKQSDPRLQDSYQEFNNRDLEMGEGASGGFMVPQQFSQEIRQVEPGEAIVRPRATVVPAGNPPDASYTFPALDQSQSEGMHAGVEMTWIGEGEEKPETEPSFREVTLAPKEVAGHTVITDKLLRNWPAANQFVTTVFNRAMNAEEDYQFLRGDGVAKPLGFIQSGAAYEQSRDTGNEIKFEDVKNMYSRVKMGGQLVWIGSQELLPQLMTLQDDANQFIWQPNAREGAPGQLLGIPFLFSERTPGLGDKGDLSLVDLNYYMIKDGSGPFVAASEHVYFKRNKTVIKIFWNVDGQPWLTEPLQLENDYQVSPFVILAE